MQPRVFLFAAIAAVSFAVSAAGQSIPEVVKQRQQDMKAMAAAAKTIAGMFKSPETYSPAAFKNAAETIRSRSGTRLYASFQAVTTVDGSEANELIAAERERFARLSNDLERYAGALAAAASDSAAPMPDSMRMQKGETVSGGPFGNRLSNEAMGAAMSSEHAFHMMLQSCTSCHSRYRLRD